MSIILEKEALEKIWTSKNFPGPKCKCNLPHAQKEEEEEEEEEDSRHELNDEKAATIAWSKPLGIVL